MRTTVRYKGIRCDCVRIVYLARRRHSAPHLRDILFHGGEGRDLMSCRPPSWIYAAMERQNELAKTARSVSPLVPFCVVPPRLVLCVSFLRLVMSSRSSSRHRLVAMSSCCHVVLLFVSCGRLVHASRGVLLVAAGCCLLCRLVGMWAVLSSVLSVSPSSSSSNRAMLCLLRRWGALLVS